MAGRTSGHAVILYGLETVPVLVSPATNESPSVPFTTACTAHGGKVETIKRCATSQKVIEKDAKKGDRLVRAFELGKGRFLLLADDDFEELQPETDHNITIEETLELSDVDPIRWTGQAQYLGVDAGEAPVIDRRAIRSYAKLVDGLGDASEGDGLLAVGRWASRTTDRLVGIYQWKRRLVLQGLRRPEEIRDLMQIVAAEIASPSELAIVTPILAALRVDHLDAKAFPDEKYIATVKLLQKKIAEPPKPKRRTSAK